MRALAAGALLALAAFEGYKLIESPGNQLFGKTLVSGPKNERVVALTYDDGPNPPYTNQILDVLRAEHVRATFFVVGRAVHAYPKVARREVDDGNAIGNHTWNHGHLLLYDGTGLRKTLERTDAEIYAATGVHTRIMRPPFGARDWLVLGEVRKLGYTPVMWSVPLANDWEYPPARVIASRVLRYVGDGVDHRPARWKPRHRLQRLARARARLRPQRRRGSDAADRGEAQARGLQVRHDSRAPAADPLTYAYRRPRSRMKPSA